MECRLSSTKTKTKPDAKPENTPIAKEYKSVGQVKVARAKQFVMQTKLAEFAEAEVEEKKVERVAESFEKQFGANQGLIEQGLDKQKNAVMLRLMSRRNQSMSRTLKDI